MKEIYFDKNSANPIFLDITINTVGFSTTKIINRTKGNTIQDYTAGNIFKINLGNANELSTTWLQIKTTVDFRISNTPNNAQKCILTDTFENVNPNNTSFKNEHGVDTFDIITRNYKLIPM